MFTICSQFVYNLFIFCSYGVHIYMLYYIMKGGDSVKDLFPCNRFHYHRKNLLTWSKKFDIISKKFIEQ